ncbi:flavin monoamine oxidase family protein [Pseudarthrobacter sp. Y6]|uniref:flavin monoamine oxidase family protein n=1 Tax=Pseudarthrobacter sp. Y6 TaxID=3418422 RepID=UPI003CF440AE
MKHENLPHCNVIIAGAGIAGLVAADALTRAGKTVMVFEARDRIGGRAHSIHTPGGTIELGATWFWANEPLVQSLADELGIDSFAQHREGDALFDPDGRQMQRLDGNPIDAPSARFVPGAQELPRRLADRLPYGTLRLSDPVTAIALTGDGVRVEAGSGSLAADHVVIAVPPPLAVDQISFTPPLPTAVQQSAEAMAVWMGGTVKAVAVYDDAFWRAEGLSGSAISYHGPFREFHDHGGPGTSLAALFAFAPAEQFTGADTPAIERAFREQLGKMFGSAATTPCEVHIIDWSRETFTTPQIPAANASTGSYGAPALQHPVEGHIHWASTETDTQYAGHLEGAIRAGMQAARRILASTTTD